MEQLVDSIISLGYHYVLIDCPAGIDVGFINAISPAREALIVTTPEITSIRWGARGGRGAEGASGRVRCDAAVVWYGGGAGAPAPPQAGGSHRTSAGRRPCRLRRL